MDRRTFLQASASASLATAAGSLTGAFDDSARADQAKPDSDGARRIGPNDRIRVAVMGVRGRGSALLTGFADQADVDVRYVADVEESKSLNDVRRAVIVSASKTISSARP